jgi:multiple sugar transport system substrate-binding protein
MNSKEISLQRVMLPYALRDPFRQSHFESEEYKQLWPDAPDYLATLQEGAKTGLLDLSLIQIDRYEEGIRQAVSKTWAGQDPQAIADELATQWDQLTQRIGVDKQKRVYADWAGKPSAYPS